MHDPRPKSHSEYLELAHLELDGELGTSDLRLLEEHAALCHQCRAARAETAALEAVLAQSRIAPDPDLARRVVENLPPAVWEMRRPGSWRVAALAFAALLGAAWLVTSQSEPLGEALPWIGTLSAIAELLRSAALAGAGLLAASWSGVGLALGEILSRSRFGLLAFGAFVLGVDCLFLRYLWRLSLLEARPGHGRPEGRPEDRSR